MGQEPNFCSLGNNDLVHLQNSSEPPKWVSQSLGMLYPLPPPFGDFIFSRQFRAPKIIENHVYGIIFVDRNLFPTEFPVKISIILGE